MAPTAEQPPLSPEKGATDHPPCDEDLEERQQPRRTINLRTFVACVLIFILIAVGLALGLGLGLGLHRNKNSPSSLQTTEANFNYSSFYGIPDVLPIVPASQLINRTELDMKTGFVVSNQTTVREYTLNITQNLASPDGFQKPMILINDQFPGPLIEANSGDIIRVLVNNLMSNWSTTMHWHGIDQKNSVEMDGVAAVTQCGIPPGQNFTYEFATEGQRGSFWYHSHLSTQYSDGMMGPLIIHDPTEEVPPVDAEKILFLGDWYHTYSSVVLASYLNPTSKWINEPGVEPLPDNILMNGQNVYNCSVQSTTYPPNSTSVACTGGELYATKVETNNTYRLRLINHSSFFSFWFSIDNHTVEIVEIEGTEIVPIIARGVNVNIGQRYSVIVKANQTAGNYHMRATFPTSCFLPFIPYNNTALTSGGFNVLGVLSYDDFDPTIPTIGVAGNTTNPYGAIDNPFNWWVWEGCDDMPFNMTVPMRQAAAYNVSAENLQYMEYSFRQTQNDNRIFLNKTAWAPLENNATLYKALDPGTFNASNINSYNSWDLAPDQQVLLSPDATSGVQLVINSQDGMEHPWHLHGHAPQIIGWGAGYYGALPNGTTWNMENPMRRDTITIPAMSHVVLRWQNDNPGIWALHCHVAWHMEGGMFMMMAEQPEKLQSIFAGMNAESRSKAFGFCGIEDDQAFGTYADGEYDPANLAPQSLI